MVEATKAGKPEPKAADVKSFTIKDGKITIVVKDGKDHVAKFTVDPSKKPAEMEIAPEDGPAEFAMKAIYMTKETDKGLELTIALGAGPDATRPKNFEGKGEQEMVMKLFRKK